MTQRDLLDLSAAPRDALERLIYLGGVRERTHQELERAVREAYFEARLTGRLDEALALRLHSHKRVMAYTRAANESKGRLVRWGDHRA